MRPLYNVLQKYLSSSYVESQHLYIGSVENFRKRFSSCFKDTLGADIGISYYRHIVIHYMRNSINDFYKDNEGMKEKIQVILSDLAAHSQQTDLRNYATTSITNSFMISENELYYVKKVCSVWHQLIGMTRKIPESSNNPSISVKKNDLKSVAVNVMKSPYCSPIKYDKETDALVLLKRHTSFTHFKSKEQYQAITHCMYGKKDLFLTLPTGGGKSLVYLLPALSRPDQIQLVIVPLQSLIRDIMLVAQHYQLSCTQFSNDTQKPTSLVIVHMNVDGFSVQSLKRFIGKNYSKINAIFFDEAHLLCSWNNLMGTDDLIGLRGNLDIKLVFISATLPLTTIEKISRMMCLEEYDVIQKFDDNPKMRYEVFLWSYLIKHYFLLTALKIQPYSFNY